MALRTLVALALSIVGASTAPAIAGTPSNPASTRCGNSDGGGLATSVRASGVSCDKAVSIANCYTGGRASQCLADGRCRIERFRCLASQRGDVDVSSSVRCSKDGGRRLIRFEVAN